MRNRMARGKILLHPELLVLTTTLLLIFYLRFRRGVAIGVSVPFGNGNAQARLLLGVVTLWDKIERRHLIRHLYPLSLKGSVYGANDVVRTIFVVGEPETEA